MTDIEYKLIDGLSAVLPCACGSVDTDSPSELPYVAFEQLSNGVATRYLDSGEPRYYAPNYRITAYTEDNDKVQAKELLETADAYMRQYKIFRTFGPQRVASPVSGVFKMISLYEGNLYNADDGRIYQR